MATTSIGCAVIGAGLWGAAHASVFASHPQSRLVGVCDLDEERARLLADRYGVPAYTRLRDLLSNPEVDALGIATPDHAHKDPVIRAAEAGKHILVEKPLATTVDDVAAIAAAVEATGVRLMVDFHTRYSPPHNIAKDSIDKGELGDLISAYYRLNDTIAVPLELLAWSKHSSILWFLGSHVVDTLRWLLNSEVMRVYAREIRGVLESKKLDVADGYHSILEFENGAVASVETNWVIPRSHPNINDIKINLLGTKGMIDMDLTNHGGMRRFLSDKVDQPDLFVQPQVHGKYVGFAHAAIGDFCSRLATGDDFIITLDDGVKATRVVCALLESSRARSPVELRY